METFSPSGGKDFPSIIVLHGATGVEFANRFIAGVAQNFADQGFVVHLVHYFDRTGVVYADDATIRESSHLWLKTIDDAVAYIHGQRPKAKIGIFGYSLGGYLAAAESVSNPEIAAAVVLSGGLDEATARAAHRAPPVLILHGADDSRVPVSEARRLEAALKKNGGSPTVHIYPAEGHIMKTSTFADVVQRGAAFFRDHLSSNPKKPNL